jgi:signal transduction histidine kinase
VTLVSELESANTRLRQYAKEIEELSAAKERVRIAREIHDAVGHGLTVVNVQLEAARGLVDTDPARTRSAIERAQTVAREALVDVRKSVGMMRAHGAPAPLVDRVASLVEEHSFATFQVSGAPRATGPAAEFALYRAAQEALTNVAKHAGATSAQVVLAFEKSEVVLRVSDDGRGSERSTGGFGLTGMRERAELLGGRVEIASEPGKGFSIHVTVPT